MRTKPVILWALLGLLCGAIGLARPYTSSPFDRGFHDAQMHIHAHEGSPHLHAHTYPESVGDEDCSQGSCELACRCHEHHHHGEPPTDDAIPGKTRDSNPAPSATVPVAVAFPSRPPPAHQGQIWPRVRALSRDQLIHLRTIVMLT